MNRLLVMALAAMCSAAAAAQDIYAPVLGEIAMNSRMIQLAQRQYQSALAENATGLTPDNPQVEAGYLWGNKLTGNRKDISVSQEFDFPTVYGKLRAVSREKNTAAAEMLDYQRLEVLVEAKELLVELTYWNALHRLATAQLEYARRIMDSYARLMDKGEATQVDYNKASLNLTDFENEATRIDVERDRIIDRLTVLNGGRAVTFDCDAFDPRPLPADFEQWYAEAEQLNPALRHLKSQIEVGRRNVSLAKALGLPKLSVGYQGEYVAGSDFSGVTVGVSIPLWQNRNKVRAAQSQKAVAEESLGAALDDYYLSMKSLYTRARALGDMAQRYSASLKDASNDGLLYKALAYGQMTLLEYVNEVQYAFTMHDKLLATQRDRELAMARLCSFQLLEYTRD